MVDLEIVSFLSLVFLGIVFSYIAGRYRKRAAENCGEARVRHSLAKYCQNKDAHVLSNITLRLEDGSTTQIDHILIATKGIFIIETKHYKGWIFAKANSRVIQHAKGTGDQQLMGPSKSAKITYQTPPLSITL